MKNKEIVQHLIELQNLRKREEKSGISKLSVKVGYIVRKNIDVLERSYKPYADILQDIQKKYDVDGNKVRKGKQKDYEEELKELIEVDNTDICIEKILLKDFEKCKDLTMEDQDVLFFMIEE